MPRSINIAEFNTSDGLPDNVTRKLNANFNRVAQLVGGESFASQYDPAVVELKIHQAIESLRSDLAAIINAMDKRLSDRIDGVETDLSALAARVATNESSISALQTKVSALETKVTTLESKVSALESLTNPVQIDHGGTGKKNRVDALKALGIDWGTGEPSATGTANTFYVKVL